MNKIFHAYKEDILNLFKGHYQKLITKNIDISFEEVFISTMQELQLNNIEKNQTDFLELWFNRVHYQHFLQSFLEKPFTEIIFHSHQNVIIQELSKREGLFVDVIEADDFQLSLEVFALKNKITWNYKEPFASFSINLQGHSLRATLIHHSTSANEKSKVFLRKILNETPTLAMFQLPLPVHSLLIDLVKEKKNVLISGGTGSGKTTLLRSLMAEISADEHVIVLEDTYEILNAHPSQTSFLASKDQNNKSLKDYCAYALRMSPDRLIVGEMRSHEVVPFVLAMNTGHKGLMSTIHASSAVDALTRMALLFSLFQENSDISFSLITKLVCKNIDYIVHMENKKVLEICKIIGSDNDTPFYERVYAKV